MEPEVIEKRLRRSSLGAVVADQRNAPDPERLTEASQDRLESWKQISEFIGRDQRTAMRWAKEFGMPVQRIPGSKRSRVFASRAEILQWRHQRNGAPEPSMSPANQPPVRVLQAASRKWGIRKIWAALGLVSLMIGIVVAGLLGHRPLSPTSVAFDETSVTATDIHGRRLWRHDYGRPFETERIKPDNIREFVRIADLLGDGKKEILLAVLLRVGDNPSDDFSSEIDCFSAAGSLLWTYTPHNEFRFGAHVLGDPWIPRALLVDHAGGKKTVWAAFSHHLWGNSFVVKLDAATGRAALRYVNTGTLHVLNELRKGGVTYLMTGGFNNEQDGPNLALIDEHKPFAESPQTLGTRHQCVSCPIGAPDYYFVFPRSEVNRLKEIYEDPVNGIDFDGTQFDVSIQDLWNRDKSTRTVYSFSTSQLIAPMSVRYSFEYEKHHQVLERIGKLSHSLANCPERRQPPPIRMWTPTQGWKEIYPNPEQK